MPSGIRFSLRIALIACAAIVLVISVATKDWRSAIWSGTAIGLTVELLLLSHRPRPVGFDRCTQCGRHRIGGGVFVAGVGSICFECEERKFGTDLLQDTDDDRA